VTIVRHLDLHYRISFVLNQKTFIVLGCLLARETLLPASGCLLCEVYYFQILRRGLDLHLKRFGARLHLNLFIWSLLRGLNSFGLHLRK
jgi:hypothetical protein